MFHRAIASSARAPAPPLQPNGGAVNVQKTENNKRKFDRSMSSTSSLGQLHQHVSFSENDFDDVIDLTAPSAQPRQVQYPQLDAVRYPDLPPSAANQPPESSDAPAPWSSSPPSHFQRLNRSEPSAEASRPMKRRTLPDSFNKAKEEEDVQFKQAFTPLWRTQAGKSPYPWNKSASVVKDEQKEFRKRNRMTKEVAKPAPAKASFDVTRGPIQLSKEQENVIKAVVQDGKSVFFTGSAGTGKSVLMRSIIKEFKHKFRRESDRLAITASTGLAACLIEGQTLHSWAGIGLGKEEVPELVKKIKRNPKNKAKWLRTKVLVVDEISMVDGDLFDKLEQIARNIRNSGQPFGGIQLVVTGDFFQLPPVPEKSQAAKFAFDATTWNPCINHTILLTHVFRQKDPVFAAMLNEMRMGKLSPNTIANFTKLSRPLDFKDEVEATELFPTRVEVERANTTRMQKLSGQPMTFDAIDSGINDMVARNKILQNFMAPESITLKKGAQVMLIKNIDSQLVNGSLGKVQSFMDESTFHVYKDDEETFLQAQEPDDGANAEERAAAREKIQKMRLQGKGDSVTKYWPMVRFTLPDGSYRELLCQPEEWKTENQNNEIIAKRQQIPLILAWALSIHKAQGQTLTRVKVDLGKVFERGQAYVALSRATSQAGLQVLRFDQKKVMVHPRVITFYSKLAGSETLGTKTAIKAVPKTEEDEDEELAYAYA